MIFLNNLICAFCICTNRIKQRKEEKGVKQQKKKHHNTGTAGRKRPFLSFVLAGALAVSSFAMANPQSLQAGEPAEPDPVLEQFNADGTFETGSGLSKWTVDPAGPATHKTKRAEGDAASVYQTIYDFWSPTDLSYTMTQTLSLPAGSYQLTADAMGNDGMQVYVYFNGKVSTDCADDPGWNVWTKVGEDSVFTLTEDTEAQVGIYVVLTSNGWGDVDNITLTDAGDAAETGTQDIADIGSGDDGTPDEPGDVDTPDPVEAGIKVDYVNGIDDDFIGGVDVSSYVSQKNSGVNYYDFEGNELDDQGFFNLLAASGVNYVRIRVWNDPYNADGKGYGGGNNDVDTAVKIGQWATRAGMRVLIDFHYSDFWTDPGKQYVPKAWEGLNLTEKADALSTFTTESLNTLLEAGVDVGMVQVGNETNASFCGEKDWDSICTLFSAGCDAVHEVAKAHSCEILAVLHFADPQNGQYAAYAKELDAHHVDYDVFASSYYPFFHGTTENLTNVLKNVAETYGKKVMVAETSWANTLEDGDGHDNQIRKGNNDTRHYDFSAYGQATEVRTVMQAVADVGEAGIGVFYWEPAWIPVNVYDKESDQAEEVLAANQKAWETYGSGWATSYGGEYQEDAATWWGGSAMDNQAMFDFYGHPLESLKVFQYVRTGTDVTNPDIASVSVSDVTVEEGQDITLPEAFVTYNDGTEENVSVTWNQDALQNASSGGPGTYEIPGTAAVGEPLRTVLCTLTVMPKNYLDDASLESGTAAAWTSSDENILTRKADNNARTGDYALKFYNGTDFSASAYRTVTLDAGTYCLGTYLQGGDAGDEAVFTLSASIDGQEVGKDTNGTVTGWKNWYNAEIRPITIEKDDTVLTITVSAENISAGGWGSWDDFYINRIHVHTMTKTEAVPATCTEAGNIEYYTCEDCGKIFRDSAGENQITIEDTVITASGHTESNWIVDREATETAAGSRHTECTVCGVVLQTEEIPALTPGETPDQGDQDPVIDPSQDPTTPSGTDTDNGAPDESDGKVPAADEKNVSPQTGDAANLSLWILLLGASAAAAVTIIRKKAR